MSISDVPPEVTALHLRLFERYMGILIDRLASLHEWAIKFEDATDETFGNTAIGEEADALMHRIECLLGLPIVGEPPIISPSEEQLPKALSLLAGEIADLRDSERALKTELGRHLQDNPSAIYDANYSASIPSTETPEEEQTHERDDEPLRLHEVQPAVRPDDPTDESARSDGFDGEGRAGEPLLPGAGQGGVEQEPVAEADVRATPTMTPEELQAWQQRVDAGDSPQTTKPKGRGGHNVVWTQEMRDAAAERARNRRKAAPFGLRVKTETPSLSGSTPPETQIHTTHVTPEEAALSDAAIIRAHWPRVEEEIFLPPPAKASEALPDCTCPEGWWDIPRGVGTARIPSSKHDAACPLHRHRWRLPSASSDGEGGKYTGVCECGETKLHEPFGVEDNRAAAAKEQQVKAGLVGAAARTANRHTAAVSA